MYTCYIQSFKTLASFCSWAGWFESYLVKNLRRHIFAWCGSYDKLLFLCTIKIIRNKNNKIIIIDTLKFKKYYFNSKRENFIRWLQTVLTVCIKEANCFVTVYAILSLTCILRNLVFINGFVTSKALLTEVNWHLISSSSSSRQISFPLNMSHSDWTDWHSDFFSINWLFRLVWNTINRAVPSKGLSREFAVILLKF